MVRLPLKWHFDPTMALGKSHQVALNRSLQLERRYQRNPDKWIRYRGGIEEYFELGKITPAVSSERSTVITSTKSCRVESCVHPHNAVYKEDNLTTRSRFSQRYANSGVSRRERSPQYGCFFDLSSRAS